MGKFTPACNRRYSGEWGMKYAPLFLLLAGCSFQVPGVYGDCTAAHGGDPRTCWTALHLDKPRPATGNSYHSAGTMSLAHATCVKSGSQWWFHGAHHPSPSKSVQRATRRCWGPTTPDTRRSHHTCRTRAHYRRRRGPKCLAAI